MNSKPIVRAVDSIESQELPRSRGASMRVLLGPEDQMPNYHTREIRIEPGGYIPAHRHPDIEHQQLVLEGQMELTLDGEPRHITAGQAAYIPARVVHAYRNVSDSPVRFICIVPATETYRTEWMDDQPS